MKHIASKIIGFAAASAMLYPLTINPNAVEDCADPTYHFVTSDAFGSTVPDTTNAKTQYCGVVKVNAALRS